MDAEPVLLRVNGHRAEAEFIRRAQDADGDFAAVRDQQFPAGDVAESGPGGRGGSARRTHY